MLSILALPAFAALAFANLVPQNLEARQFAAPVNFTIPNRERFFTCTGAFFGGTCAFQNIDTGVCQVLPTGYSSAIRSARPDPGFNCTLYADSTCAGTSISFSFPYYNFNNLGVDYGSFPADIDAKAQSFRCVRSGLAPPGTTGAGTGIFPITASSCPT